MGYHREGLTLLLCAPEDAFSVVGQGMVAHTACGVSSAAAAHGSLAQIPSVNPNELGSPQLLKRHKLIP